MNKHVPQRGNQRRPRPDLRARAIIYGLTWLPSVALAIVVLPAFAPIFDELERQGKLPWVLRTLGALVRFSEAWWYLPPLLTVIAFVAADRAILSLFRKRKWE